MEQISGLVWETERPAWNDPRTSPNFWLLGYEWNFTLLYHAGNRYEIDLNKVADFRRLDSVRDLRVSVYIHNEKISTHCYMSARNADGNYWHSVVNAADSKLFSDMRRGKWTVTFIFQYNQPIMLRLSKNVTEPPSFQDKCVQVCSDIPPDLEILSGDFRQLLEREIFSDVKLRCGGRNISAHRSILAARSDVFTDMFRNKMVESETDTIDVVDVDSEILDLLMQYVYSGKLPDLSDDTAARLYEASDKYSIHSLKKSCVDWMVRNLTAENCLCLLVVADAHSDEDFKGRVANFVAENLELVNKDDWSKFNEDHGGLAISVYEMRLAPALAKQS